MSASVRRDARGIAFVPARQTVTARSGGHPKSWHTDGSGDAGVYLPGPCTGR